MKRRTFLNYLLVVLLFNQALVVAQVSDLSITGRHLVGKKRVSRNEIDYTYTLTINNAGMQLPGVVVTVSSLTKDTVIQEDKVVFGGISHGSTQSTDTFTLRQNRLQLFDPANLVFSFFAETSSNTSPTADAGGNQNIAVGKVVNLDGSGSEDADGDTLAFTWSFQSIPSGSQAVLEGGQEAKPSFVVDLPGKYVVALIVNDGASSSAEDSITVLAHASPDDYISCDLEPRHFQLQASSAPVVGDSVQDYNPANFAFPGQILGLDLLSGANLEAFYTDLDGNIHGDLVLRAPGSPSVQVWLSDDNGIFTSPVEYSTGGSPLSALVVGNFIGDIWQDIAVASEDGNIDFFEGMGGGAFIHRPVYRLNAGQTVVRLAVDDLDGDGDDDLLISTGLGVIVFLQDNDLLDSNLIKNGDFSLGLSFWQIDVVGGEKYETAGIVDVVDGKSVLQENNSFRTTLKQSFIIPDTADRLFFDLVSEMLDEPQGGIPDAFEVSLLTAESISPVPTIAADSTSFLNINPGSVITMANGVSKNGNHVTVDLSGTTAGTMVTLYFDLIGNKPGSGSSVSIDNVDAGSAITIVNSFTGNDLSGTFIAAGGVGSCDMDGNGFPEILIHDHGGHDLVVYSRDQDGTFSRSQVISLSGN